MGEEAGACPGRLDKLFVAGALMAAGAAVVVGLLVFVEPAVSRLGWAFALSLLAAAGMYRPGCEAGSAREVAKRWAVPILGLALGLPYIGVRVTWSVPEWWIPSRRPRQTPCAETTNENGAGGAGDLRPSDAA